MGIRGGSAGPAGERDSIAYQLATEIDKRKFSPFVVAAGLGSTLTLLADVLRVQERRIAALESERGPKR